MGGPGGEDHIDQCAGLGQLAGQIGRLVTGDAAGHAEDDPFALSGLEGMWVPLSSQVDSAAKTDCATDFTDDTDLRHWHSSV